MRTGTRGRGLCDMGLGDVRLGDVRLGDLNKPDFCAEFVKYNFRWSRECKLSPVRRIGDNDFLRVISWACWYYHPLLVLVNYLLC